MNSALLYAHNYRVVIEYDGAAFHGWQKQPGLRTVQGELERVIRSYIRTDEVSGLQSAGRTDSGVHAWAQVVNFRTNATFDLFRFKHAVSSMLKGDVSVLDVAEVPSGFNALHSALSRQYTYRIVNRPAPPVLDKHRVWHVATKLDREFMQHSAAMLVGEKDFKSFQGTGCLSKNTVKSIFESELTVTGDYLEYRVLGKGFLKHMVRNIVGTLVQLGKGNLPIATMEEVLAVRDRTRAGMTAPSHGLFFDYVQYEGWNSRESIPAGYNSHFGPQSSSNL